jgi:adenylate kinase family enzyme
MWRVAIVGCSGGGKSTLARALGRELDLPVVHLDRLFWKAGWVESERDEFRDRVSDALQGESWIVDGNYTSIAETTLARADTIIWVDQRRLLCLWRALLRPLSYRRGTRPDMAPGCAERFDPIFVRYIWTWDRLARPRLEAAIATHGRAADLICLETDAEIDAFVANAAGGC